MSHHRVLHTGTFWKTPDTEKTCYKSLELAVKWPRLPPFLVTMWCPPLAEAAQATMPEAIGMSAMPCDGYANIYQLSHGWREPLGRGAWDLGPLCMNNPCCMLSLAFSVEDHLREPEVWTEVSGRGP